MRLRGQNISAHLKRSSLAMTDAKRMWDEYCAHEIPRAKRILHEVGYTLDQEQPHIGGERYLMQAVTTASGRKLILLARRDRDHVRAVVKITDDSAGKQELAHERACRSILSRIKFAYRVFHSPEELFYGERDGRLISIQQFIPQEHAFLERPLPEQFTFALAAFKAQESAHATTHEHARLIASTFKTMRADDYRTQFEQFRMNILREAPPGLALSETLEGGAHYLEAARGEIERYAHFLTHTDFVPHNFRINKGVLYLLDHSSLRFGNKYEGWARFINFMTLYNPELANALIRYVADNRTPEESVALKAMRVYRLGEIIWYYIHTLSKCSGDLHTLNAARATFWAQVLHATLRDEPVPEQTLAAYRALREKLRDADEKRRQQGLH